jgi:hypothetical protein
MGVETNRQTASNAVLLCVAHGHGQSWEAFCLDFDLAVQGQSLPEVRGRIEDAISDYVHAASGESEPARSQLLNRRAPFFVRFQWAVRFFVRTLSGRNPDGDSTVGFPVSCPA